MIPPQSLKSRSDFCDYLFQDEVSASISKTDSNHTLTDNHESIQDEAVIPKTDSIPLFTDKSESIPKEITDSIQLFTDDSESNPLLEKDIYTNVINRIEVMNEELGVFNNGDLDTEWYDVVDISAVRLRNDFIRAGFSNSDFNHEEDFENNSVVDVNDNTIGIDEIYRLVDLDKIYHIVITDNKQGEDNNNDLALDWYDVVDVYSVRIRINLRFDQETSFLHPSSTTTIKFRVPFLMIDQGTSFNSSINSSVLSSVSLGSPSTDEPSGVQVATIVVHFDDNNLNVDNKGKEYQQSIVIITMEYQQTIFSIIESYFKSQSSYKPFICNPRASSVFSQGLISVLF